jgi:hypothetical protein
MSFPDPKDGVRDAIVDGRRLRAVRLGELFGRPMNDDGSYDVEIDGLEGIYTDHSAWIWVEVVP